MLISGNSDSNASNLLSPNKSAELLPPELQPTSIPVKVSVWLAHTCTYTHIHTCTCTHTHTHTNI